ncbi:MAG: DUF2071 domain-containing protein [Polyangiaceae bacterium]|nr:DUF2071 domain-containing protein [Polyangiaceae bacterium]
MSCAKLDRITPTRRPEGVRISGYQRWRHLLFVHYRYPVEEVRKLVPSELELDLWDGEALVGVVPFEMKDIRLAWFPAAFGLDFLETNVRTYVHYKGEPGVYFFSLEASSWLAVKGARVGWGLPYHHATMSVDHRCGAIHYETRRHSDETAMHRARYRPGDELGPSAPGTLEFFLLERYYLFAKRRGRIEKGHVHHVPYPAQRVSEFEVSDGLVAAAGLGPAPPSPAFIHYSSGVDVEVFGPWPLE